MFLCAKGKLLYWYAKQRALNRVQGVFLFAITQLRIILFCHMFGTLKTKNCQGQTVLIVCVFTNKWNALYIPKENSVLKICLQKRRFPVLEERAVK